MLETPQTPNQSLEPMARSVTRPADAGRAPALAMAHHITLGDRPMRLLLTYLVLFAATKAVATGDDFTKAKDLREAAVSSFKFSEDMRPEDKVLASVSNGASRNAPKPSLEPQMPITDLGDVVALDPFEVTEDKIPVVTHKSESPVEKYFESGALYTHEGKKITTRIVLSPITGFGVSFSW